MLVVHDQLVYEWYADGLTRNSLFPLAAAAKALVGSLLLAKTVEQGIVAFDEPVYHYLPEWKNDDRKRGITFRQLASHTSGLEDVPFRGENGRYQQEAWKKRYEADPVSRFKLAQELVPLRQDPGTQYSYSGVGYYILSYTLRQARNQKHASDDLKDLYADEFMKRLGIHQAAWSLSYGSAHHWEGLTLYSIGSGADLTGRAMARVAQMIKNQGVYNGRSVLNAKVVREMLEPPQITGIQERNAGQFPVAAAGWYLNRNSYFQGLPSDALIAFGAGPQVVIVCPSLDLIIVRTGRSLDGSTRGMKDASSIYFRPIIQFFSKTS